MKTLLVSILVMVMLFSLSVSAYTSFFKIPFKSKAVKLIAFVTLGAVTTIVTFTVCLTIVWPPVM